MEPNVSDNSEHTDEESTNLEDHQLEKNKSLDSDSCTEHNDSEHTDEESKSEHPTSELSDEKLNDTVLNDEDLSDEEYLEKMQILLTCKMSYLTRANDFLCQKTIHDLMCLDNAYRNAPTKEIAEKVGDLLASLRVTDLFLMIWKKYFEMDFLNNENILVEKSMNIIMYVLWNFTDASRALCFEVFRSDIPNVILHCLKSDYLHPSKVSESRYKLVVDGLMQILFNMVQKIPESSNALREQKAMDILQRFRNSSDNETACISLFVQGYIATEKENEKMNADDSNFIFMKEILRSILEPDKFDMSSYPFAASELVLALNRLAVNDKNKTRIVNVGLLPLYVQLLQPERSEEEQAAAVEGLWILAFKCAHAVKMQPGCEDALNRLKDAKSERVRKLVEGILWTLKKCEEKQEPLVQIPISKQGEGGHVFISYQWDSQPMVTKLASDLRNAGFHVWLDLDNMAGSIMESMARAVEEAAVVIVCVSQRYKESPCCQAEAEYTFERRKKILPLRMQHKYRPDDWLGILVGKKLMHDFSSDEKYDQSLRSIIKELGERGKAKRSKDVVDHPVSEMVPIIKDSVSTVHTSKEDHDSNYATWSKEELASWLQRSNLEEFLEWFRDIDGKLLEEYKRLRQIAPETFFSMLKDKHSLKSILGLSAALEQL